MEKWSLRSSRNGQIRSIILLSCMFLYACMASTPNNTDGYPTLLTNKDLRQNILEFYYANRDKGEDSSSKAIVHLSVKFLNDTIQYDLDKCLAVYEVLDRNVVSYTRLDNLTILISLPQLGTGIDTINPMALRQIDLTLNKDVLMKALKKDFPEMYKIYRKAKKETPFGQRTVTDEMLVLDDRWQELKFVKDSLVWKMVDYGKKNRKTGN